MKNLYKTLIVSLLSLHSFCQNAKIVDSPSGTVISNIGGTDIPYSASILDIRSNNKGILIPRTDADLGSPTEGLLYYNTVGHNFRYYDGAAWQNAIFGNQWNVNGTSISYSLGNVGIGTTSPVGALNISNGTGANLYFHNNATGSTITDGFYVGNGGSTSGLIWNKENASIRFGTNDSEQMAILSNGNVGIGYNAPTYKLSVNGSLYSNGQYVNGNSEIVGTAQVGGSATFSNTVNVNGTLNANGNLAVDGNITTNTGKGIVRSGNANQLAIVDFSTGSNLSWSLAPGASACCINMSFAAFIEPPCIAFGRLSGGTSTNADFIAYTISSITTTSATVRITNIGNANSSASNTELNAMLIGRK
ncbi:hypothetical protein GCM10011514_44240 [Emticicia aquatilis]|uniref:Uncharacterized protein n=1 Tax=Emticicia aquatilis TaxID=1537369 RepID=A0A916Z4K3_9BACT|nr:hypothetical protein [Emticicia aquatilis]GGD75466.1 hypothetical protein GCM10011514_44240 [Emticicia aquatilis]